LDRFLSSAGPVTGAQRVLALARTDAVLLRESISLGVFHNALTRFIATDVAPQHLFASYNEWEPTAD
jgi:hypothetical protein